MGNDPPASSSLPELADLDPAFDLTTFETERDATSGRGSVDRTTADDHADRPAQGPPPPEPPAEDVRLSSDDASDEPSRPFPTQSALQLGIAAILAIGAVAIVLLLMRGAPPAAVTRTPPPADAPHPQAAVQGQEQPPGRSESGTTAARPADAGTARPKSPAPRSADAAVSGRSVPTSGAGPRGRPASIHRSAEPPARAEVRPRAPVAAVVAHSTINVNALPWANVWIDGRSVGETPLANVRVAVGDHEVVFRHPELGERRVRAVVEAGIAARVTADMRR